MAMHTELEIHKSAEELLGIVLNLVRNIPRGIDFVGQVIKPWRRSTRRKTVSEATMRIAVAPDDELLATANSYFGLLGQATASHHERAQIARLLLRRGYTVNAALTQTYRKRGAP